MLGRIAVLTCTVGWSAHAVVKQPLQCTPDDSECIAGLAESGRRVLLQQTFKKHNSEGMFEYLASHRPEEGACDMRGSWNQDGEIVHFASNESAVELDVAGHRLSLLANPDNSGSYWRFDGAVVETLPMADQPRSVQQGVASMMHTMAGREKTLSSALGARDMDGKSMPCAYKLHMLLLTMAKASHNPYNDPNNWGEYGFGVNNGCPAAAEANWTCSIGNNGPWERPPQDYSSAHGNKKLNVKCKADPLTDKNCGGLCGAKCDCWESICGSEYKCDYNPVCCAHDKACGTKLKYFHPDCANVIQVMKACSNDGLKQRP